MALNFLKEVVWEHTPLSKVNYSKLAIHLFASLLIVVGTTGASKGDMVAALTTWLWGILVYIGGYLQVGEKSDIQ